MALLTKMQIKGGDTSLPVRQAIVPEGYFAYLEGLGILAGSANPDIPALSTALARFQTALSIDSTYLPARVAHATTQSKLLLSDEPHRLQELAPTLNELWELSPYDEALAAAHARVQLALGHTANALDVLEIAIAENAESLKLRELYHRALLESGDVSNAAAEADQVEALRGKNQ